MRFSRSIVAGFLLIASSCSSGADESAPASPAEATETQESEAAAPDPAVDPPVDSLASTDPPPPADGELVYDFTIDVDTNESPTITVVTMNGSADVQSDTEYLVLEHWSATWVPVAVLPNDTARPIPMACGPDLDTSACGTEDGERFILPDESGIARIFRLPDLDAGVYRVRPLTRIFHRAA